MRLKDNFYIKSKKGKEHKFYIKSKKVKEHQHDITYYVECPEENCYETI